ncbi:hypothetical protein E2C01_072861 [Portunus trituberculatus]|uniref:Uncharacterized protein n=1 Tax=Portunus trituberculatus TaxID=210409 RepID=A0A5B7I904_PORTR|nr:hypothetical protein [Portunus trituberculatus]
MCRVEKLDQLSLFLSSSQGSTFGFQTLASQVDGSQPGTSGAMQRLGWARPAGAAGLEVKMVLVSAVGPATTGGFHALVPGTVKAVHSALDTFRTVYSGGVGDSHPAPMPGGCPTNQDMEVGVCHTASMPGGQTPMQNIDGGICDLRYGSHA